MAGGCRALLAAVVLLLLLVTSDSDAGRTPSATLTPSASSSAPPPASLVATSPPPLSSAPATPATSSGASSFNLSTWKALESGVVPPLSGLPNSPPTPPAVSANLVGCDPMKVAYALFTHCRDAPRPQPVLNATCCGVAVSTVARPTCFCLVQKETAFIMSSVHNKDSMGMLLERCGALPGLRRIVEDPCGDTTHTMDDHGCAASVKASASCQPYKIATVVGWTMVCVLAAGVIYTLWRQSLARRAHM